MTTYHMYCPDCNLVMAECQCPRCRKCDHRLETCVCRQAPPTEYPPFRDENFDRYDLYDFIEDSDPDDEDCDIISDDPEEDLDDSSTDDNTPR